MMVPFYLFADTEELNESNLISSTALPFIIGLKTKVRIQTHSTDDWSWMMNTERLQRNDEDEKSVDKLYDQCWW